MSAGVFVFNPFAEAYIAFGKAFTPVKHQAMLAEDLANLPQYLCEPQDTVLIGKTPSAAFLGSLRNAGFPVPNFVELTKGDRGTAPSLVGWLRQHACATKGAYSLDKVGGLRPWAWGPDSIELLAPLLDRLDGEKRVTADWWNERITNLYSKEWSAGLLRQHLKALRERQKVFRNWLCPEWVVGIVAASLDEALETVASIRQRGHHRVVVKEVHGLAGHNAIRLWEPEILPGHKQWISEITNNGRKVVVEPWLERTLDFSVQLEMEAGGIRLRGYTGLINDLKGQFLANWAEPGYEQRLPAMAVELLRVQQEDLLEFFSEIFTVLEPELRHAGYTGPVGIDCLIYRTSDGACRLKPIVEINSRYTMGRLTLELMKNVCPGECGTFRLVSLAELRSSGAAGFPQYAAELGNRAPLQFEASPRRTIRSGVVCLNDPSAAQVCLATFEVGGTPTAPYRVRTLSRTRS